MAVRAAVKPTRRRPGRAGVDGGEGVRR